MDVITKLALIGVFTAGLIGCGASDSASVSTAVKNTGGRKTANVGGESGQAAKKPLPAESAESVVEKFLAAVRNGDKNHTSDLLTDVARQELAKNGWEIQPPGTPSSSYKVGRTEILPEGNGAYVNSTWTDTSSNGENVDYEVVWVLRLQENGWKVAGMATEAVSGEDPVYFSFEHPQDMQRKREAADAALVASKRQVGEDAPQEPTTQAERSAEGSPQTQVR